MKITFVAIGSEQLAISLLSAIAKEQGHETKIAFCSALFDAESSWLGKIFDDRSQVLKAIEEQEPDVLAFSVLTMNYQWMLAVAREARILFPSVKTIFGGVHISAVPELVLERDEVDYVVVGEGDIAFPQILDAIEQGGTKEPIQNTRYKDANGDLIRGKQVGFNQDLDSLPPFDKSIWEDHIRIKDRYLTMASRGCPYRCSFCFNNFFAQLPEEKKGKYVRLRSVDHLINELAYAKEKYDIKYVDFQDDVFTVYKPWLKEFLERYKNEISVPFDCLSHPHYIDDDITRWLKEAGCQWMQMGVQSMDEEFKYQNLMRYEDSNKIVKALEYANKYKLKVKVDHMFGLPGEPISAQEKALTLYRQQSPSRIQTFWTCFLPGTKLMDDAIKDGLLSPKQVDSINNGIDFFFFNNTDNIKDPKLVKFYGSYELLFRLLPMLPLFLRRKLKPETLSKIPFAISRPIIIIMDIIYGVFSGYPYFVAMAKHHFFYMRNHLLRKIGIKPRKASKPKDVGPIKYKHLAPPKTNPEEKVAV